MLTMGVVLLQPGLTLLVSHNKWRWNGADWLTGVRALGHLDIDIENMSSRTMKEFKTAVGGSASGEAKIPIILEQLQSNDKGVLEFVAKIATKIIGSYELKFAATAPA